MEVGNTPLRGDQSHHIENTDPRGGCCHGQSGNTPGLADSLLQGSFNHTKCNNTDPGEQQVNNTHLRDNYCHNKANNSLQQADSQLQGGFNRSQNNNTDPEEQQKNNTDLREGYCHSQCDNTLGDDHQRSREVSTPEWRDQTHQLESKTELRVGNCCSQADRLEIHQVINPNQSLGFYDGQGANIVSDMAVENTSVRGHHCHQENSDNLGEVSCSNQGNNVQEQSTYSGSGDHPCQRGIEINGNQTKIMVNSGSGASSTEEEVVRPYDGKGVKGATGDCLLENKEMKGDPKEERRQERTLISEAEKGSCSESGRNKLGSEDGKYEAGNSESTQKLGGELKGRMHQERGSNGTRGKDLLTEKSARRGKEEGIDQELCVREANCVVKESMVEENCLETGTVEEKDRRQNMSTVQTTDKFTQCVSTETRLQKVKIEELQKWEPNTSNSESSKEMDSERNCRNLELTAMQQADTNMTQQASEERGVNQEKANCTLILEEENSADQQLEEECRSTDSDGEGPLPLAAGTARLQINTSASNACTEHSVSSRMRLDLLSPVGDISHPLALTSSSRDQAGDATLLSPSVDSRAKQSVKRVTFPSDEAIVSGAVEPKDPWRHAQNVTVEEIIAAYKMACQKLNCKPINKLLKQIQVRLDFQSKLAHDTSPAFIKLKIEFARVFFALFTGLAYISDGLKEQRQGLVTLVLWNNQLTHNGMTYMAAALPYTLSLETLNLGHNAIGNEGVHKLKDGLIANRSVLRLGLASTKLTCEGAVAVAEFIADSPRLLRLDLRENEIKTGGLMALSLALKVNHSLLRLDLDREPKKETVKSFIETQKALLTEIQNGCKRNFILAKEKEEKEQKMQQSASMPEITVTLCENKEEPQKNQVCPKTQKMPEGSENGVTQETVPSIPRNAEELVGTSESIVTSCSVDQNLQPAAQVELDQNQAQVSVVGTSSSEKQQLQRQDLVETHCGKGSVIEGDVRHRSSPAAFGEQPMLIPTELKSPGPESPVIVSSPIEITPRNNERLVSSPGRGHKVFFVTRVESPPENPSNQDMQWQNETLQSRKHTISTKETESPSEPLPCSASDPLTTSTVPAPAPDGSSQTESLSDLDRGVDNPGHDFETVCAKDCDHMIHGAALPNGLKAELVQRLPETTVLTTGKDGKAMSCSIEHEFTSPKTEKELEELLLEASQETCRETSGV
ncbi:protein phosphatase 1 regulatory subunit 37-like [Rhincodon typus]|uniref:protein phosphatase 1 regulatory subunit 37-like n=1 Tax=Rhincodon typus TaxID=259920 RepID=UPI002030166A|nr:protein phosphatase 1 regulatory subunit 37-like [Rhincodon typus]